MIDKFVSIADAFEGVADGSTILIGGFGASGEPTQLIDALVEQGAKDLTMVANGAGAGGDFGISRLLEHKRVRKVICSFPGRKALIFAALHKAGEVELEIVPQGTIAERIRAGGAGIPLFTPQQALARYWAQASRPKCLMASLMCSNVPSRLT